MGLTPTATKRLIEAVTMFLVSAVSLLLLMYVGYGEGRRTYEQFYLDKLMTQGRVVQNAMETYLRPGLPMKQFVGFATLTEPILAADGAITALTAFDRAGAPVFANGEMEIPSLPHASGAVTHKNEIYEVRQSGHSYHVILPLRSRFETVGHLAITIPRSVVNERVQESFQNLLIVATVLSVAFALFVSIGGPRIRTQSIPWLQVVYALIFLTMSCFVVVTLINLYSEGAQARTKALADSLGQRLAPLVRFNLNIDEIYGLDRVFTEYKRLNPDITAAGLTVNGEIRIHTDPEQVGLPWVSQSRSYEYVVQVSPPNSARSIQVAVALPTNVVYRQIARSVKNFTALFVASAFLAGLFLQIAGSVQRSHEPEDTGPEPMRGRRAVEMVPPSQSTEVAKTIDHDKALSLVKPVFFVAIFLEHLNYAFLPQFMYNVVAATGLSESYASAPFMAYYLCFALALIPSGQYAQNNSARPLMYLGLVLAAVGLTILALWPDFYIVVLARALSGIGQGMLFIGVQSYILLMASPGKKTQGAAIIVYGFQGGMISGMAIGSLLVTYLGPTGVFTLSGVVAYALALYTIAVVPVVARKGVDDMRMGFTFGQLLRNLAMALRSLEFLKTMMLIGIPAKAILTGVVIFALPLLLAQKQYAQEDIGQIIMVYAVGVVLASSFASRLVDRTGNTYAILFWGSVISSVGLFMMGLIDDPKLSAHPNSGAFATVALILGVAIVGMAHGFINAPVVTHVADSHLATQVGASSLTATYRFLERLGHIAGPIIMAQLFLFWGQSAVLLAWIGGVILLCGIIFLIPVTPGRENRASQERMS